MKAFSVVTLLFICRIETRRDIWNGRACVCVCARVFKLWHETCHAWCANVFRSREIFCICRWRHAASAGLQEAPATFFLSNKMKHFLSGRNAENARSMCSSHCFSLSTGCLVVQRPTRPVSVDEYRRDSVAICHRSSTAARWADCTLDAVDADRCTRCPRCQAASLKTFYKVVLSQTYTHVLYLYVKENSACFQALFRLGWSGCIWLLQGLVSFEKRQNYL